jgi:arylsulfatase A-like enzyme
MDLFVTVVEAAGVAIAPAHRAQLDGRSLLPVLRDPAARLGPRDLFWHYPHYHPGGATPYGAVRSGDLRLVEFFEDGRLELYDLADDPGEARDLSAARPAEAQALHRKLVAWRRGVGAQMPSPNPDHDPARADRRP